MKLLVKLRRLLQWPVNLMIGLIILTAIVWLLIHNHRVEKDSLDLELAKAVLQVGIVSVAGTLLSWVVSEADRRRADVRYRADLLTATLSRITSSYNRSKRARRDMRALGMVRGKTPVLVHVAKYDECMARLNAAQLELETIISDVETGKTSYPSRRGLTPKLNKMQEYLGGLIREYERVRSRISADEFPLRKVPRLSDFVGPVRRSKFKTEYARQHRRARRAIRNDLTELTSSSGSVGKHLSRRPSHRSS